MYPAPIQVFFLPARQGARLCLYHTPAHGLTESDCIVHIHAFAEEMNRCRRMAALTARSLATQGYSVLQIDLFGCGDSAGEFADARWEIWLDDIQVAVDWLKQRHRGAIHLWGDRLGALLAMSFAASHTEHKFDRMLLCQPVLDGKSYLARLKRMQLARQMLNKQDLSATTLSNPLTGTEFSGYEIAQELIQSLEQQNALNWQLPVSRIHSLEIGSASTMLPERQIFFSQWSQSGNPAQILFVDGPAYWQTQEICQSQRWIDAVCRIFEKENSDCN